MKTNTTLPKILFAMLFVMNEVIATAQAPQAINYQAVARDALGAPMVNATINIDAVIHSDSATGSTVYFESHSAISTNQFGLFTLKIGMGSVVTGNFSAITWGTHSYFLEIKLNGTSMGTSQLLSVPYALYAGATSPGIVATSWSGANTYLNNTVQNYTNGAVTITVPRAGNIVVEANAQMLTYHVNGQADRLLINIGTSATDGGTPFDYVAYDTPSSYPSYSGILQTFTVRKAFTVSSAGTYTYYLNGTIPYGGVNVTADNFNYCYMIATFY